MLYRTIYNTWFDMLVTETVNEHLRAHFGLNEFFHNNIWETVQHNGNLSALFKIRNGVTQGCVSIFSVLFKRQKNVYTYIHTVTANCSIPFNLKMLL